MVVGVSALAPTNAAERVALPGPVAVATEARFTRVARGDVGGAVAEDVVAVAVVQAACGRPGCEQQQHGGARPQRSHAGSVVDFGIVSGVEPLQVAAFDAFSPRNCIRWWAAQVKSDNSFPEQYAAFKYLSLVAR